MPTIQAAGGVLWRLDGRVPRVAIIHRPRRGDWSLPKGKLAPGEDHAAAALREVREETGCEARLGELAAECAYESRRGPKAVRYWNMWLDREGALECGDEVDEVTWLTFREALGRLDRQRDRDVLEAAWTLARRSAGWRAARRPAFRADERAVRGARAGA